MSTLVLMRPGKDPVTANISIEGIVFWHILYVADDVELAKSGTSAEVNRLELGVPDKLNLDANTWHIVIMNPNKVSTKYTTGIEWTQAGKTIATWPADGPKKGTLKSGENVVFDDSAFLAIAPDETADTEKGAKPGKKGPK